MTKLPNEAGSSIPKGDAKPQTIFACTDKSEPFARVIKRMLNDPRLSFAAKGVLAYLLGKPKNWTLRVNDLANHSTDRQRAIRSALNELRALGYAEFTQTNHYGTFKSGIWRVSDSPMFEPHWQKRNAVATEGQTAPSAPRCALPRCGNSHLSKNERSKIEAKESKESSPAVTLSFPPEWKPDGRSKEQQLKAIRPPKEYPSQVEFEDWVDANCEQIATYRSDLYLELCRNKWHVWRETSNHWQPIADWKKFVAGLDAHINGNA